MHQHEWVAFVAFFGGIVVPGPVLAWMVFRQAAKDRRERDDRG
jgi:hypothetical protein